MKRKDIGISEERATEIYLQAAASAPFTLDGSAFNAEFDRLYAEEVAKVAAAGKKPAKASK